MNTSKFAGPKASTNGAQEVPEKEYARRLNKRKRQLANLGILHWRLWACLAAGAITAMVLTWAALSLHLISMFWILLPSVTVLSVLRSLGKNARLHRRVERIVDFYELGVARLSHQWQGRGIGGIELRPANHLYASDLDLDVVRHHVAWGPGPRAAQALMLACRARAILDGRDRKSVV